MKTEGIERQKQSIEFDTTKHNLWSLSSRSARNQVLNSLKTTCQAGNF